MKKMQPIFCLLVLTILASCIKEPGSGSKTGNKANPFGFSTSQDITVSVKYTMPRNTPVEIYAENPLGIDALKNYVKNETLKPVVRGFTDEKGEINDLPLTLPTWVSEVFVYSPGAAAPVLLGGKIENGKVEITPEKTVAPRKASSSTRAISDTDVFWKKWTKQNFSFVENPAWSYDGTGRPDYLAEPMEISPRTLAIIDATVHKDEKFNAQHYQMEQIEISQDANVTLYFVSNGSARRNALAYYTFTGDHPSQDQINRSLTVLFPNLSSEALNTGDGVQLAYHDGNEWSARIPAGTKIGFVLLTDAWNGSTVDKSGWATYSNKKCNSYFVENTNIANRPHMAAFDAKGTFVLTFEDLPYSDRYPSAYAGNFSDDIFIVESNPITALPEPNPGVDDEQVMPPYMVAIEARGILGFEDNWPYTGDYDLNDIVVKYDSKLYLDYDYDYVGLDDTYTFLNNGGKYTNGFAVEYGFPTSAIDFEKTLISATNGVALPEFDTSTEKATLMLLEDGKDIPTGTEYKITLVFKQPQPMFGFVQPPYNPFVHIDTVPGALRKEAHLSDKQPSAKADRNLLGTGDDRSSNGRYYITDGDYPFAINLSGAESFFVPEGKEVGEIYPGYHGWVASKGTENKDWYKK